VLAAPTRRERKHAAGGAPVTNLVES